MFVYWKFCICIYHGAMVFFRRGWFVVTWWFYSRCCAFIHFIVFRRASPWLGGPYSFCPEIVSLYVSSPSCDFQNHQAPLTFQLWRNFKTLREPLYHLSYVNLDYVGRRGRRFLKRCPFCPSKGFEKDVKRAPRIFGFECEASYFLDAYLFQSVTNEA